MASSDSRATPALKRKPKAVTRRSDKQRAEDEAAEKNRLKAKEQAVLDEARRESDQRKLQYGFFEQDRWRDKGPARGSGSRGGRGGFMGDRGVAQGQLSGVGSGAGQLQGHGRRLAGERAHEGFRAPRGSRQDRETNADGNQRPKRGAGDSGPPAASSSVQQANKSSIFVSPLPKGQTELGASSSLTESYPPVKKEESNEDPSLSDDAEVIDLEELNLASSNEGALLPIPAGRQDHVDRQFYINTDSSAAVAGNKSRSGKRDVDVEDMIKIESDEEAAATRKDAAVKKEPSSSPELNRHPKHPKRIPRHKTRSEPSELTEEQKIQQTNRCVLLDELGPVIASSLAPEPTQPGSDTAHQAAPFNPRQDTLFLFQLPPRLPALHQRGVKVKPEPEDEGNEVPGPVLQPLQKAEEDEIEIKEEDAGGLPPSTEQTASTVNTDLKPGYLGKMQVWKSGKVTLDWGGVRMVVRKGYDSNFAETVVGMNVRPKVAEEQGIPGEYTGAAHSFGQVRGRMVVTPDYGAALGLEKAKKKKRRKSRRMTDDAMGTVTVSGQQEVASTAG
ncbi:MAG: hypothetical protein Q9162_002747 [Coniocarpon cinnabarinum]